MRKLLCIIWLMIGVNLFGAELPSQGLEPPEIIRDSMPGGHGGDPPVGEGISVMLVLSAIYTLKKKKAEKC